jgi:glutathione S-transferase
MFKPVILFLGSALLGKPIYENQKSEAMNEVHEALKTLDDLLEIEWKNSGSKGTFICGTENPTIADLLVFFETTNIVYFGIDRNQYANISKWFKKVYSINEVKTITHQWYAIGKQFNEMFSQV